MPPHPFWRRAPRLTLLAQAVVAFPLLIYGVDRADYLIHYQFDGLDLAVLALTIALAPGVLLLAGEAGVRRLTGLSVHRGLAGACLALATWQFVTWGLVVTGAAGLVASAIATAALWKPLSAFPRTPGEALVCAAACLALPVWLLGWSDLEVLARVPEVPRGAVAVARPHPVVIAVFDAFPMPAILDESRNIDGSLFPRFAGLAREATFYRNATANHGYTNVSIPSFLSGRMPAPEARNLPLAALHPQTLYTLLANRYRFRVVESSTRLCPEGLPGAEQLKAPRRERWAAVGYDLLQVLPMVLSGALNDRALGDLVQRLRFFGAERARARDSDVFDRAAIFHHFLNGIHAGEREWVYYVHVALPHEPWDLLPDGGRYRVPAPYQGVRLGMQDREHLFFYWTDDAWLIRENYQRLQFQLMYTDRLLGELVDRLKSAGIWDDALVMVTSDHGSSCLAANFPRDIVLPESDAVRAGKTRPNVAEVLAVPLFVKLPGQKGGGVSDENVELIDLLPTIADVLGVAVPWRMEGRTLASPSAPRAKKTFYDFDFTKLEMPPRLPGWDEPIAKRRAWFAPGADWPWRVLPAGVLVDGPVPASARRVEPARWDPQPPGALSGQLSGDAAPGQDLLLVRGGRVIATTRLQRAASGETTFLAFVRPADRAPEPPDLYVVARAP